MPAATKNITLQEDKPFVRVILLSKRTSRLYESLPRVPAALILRQQAILRFQSAPAAWKSTMFMKFQHLSLTRVHPCEPWARSRFFPRLWIELRFCMRQVMTSVACGKILLAKTNWVFHEKSSIFDRKSIYNLRPTCHSTCPLPQEYYSPRGKAVSTSNFLMPAQR